jgi:hypothetical protein
MISNGSFSSKGWCTPSPSESIREEGGKELMKVRNQLLSGCRVLTPDTRADCCTNEKWWGVRNFRPSNDALQIATRSTTVVESFLLATSFSAGSTYCKFRAWVLRVWNSKSLF